MSDTITLPRTTAQQVLKALEAVRCNALYEQDCNVCNAEEALRAALEQPEQEPVAWMYHGIRFDDTPHDSPSLIWRPEYMDAMSASKGAKATPLYAEPPRREPEQEPVADRSAFERHAKSLGYSVDPETYKG